MQSVYYNSLFFLNIVSLKVSLGSLVSKVCELRSERSEFYSWQGYIYFSSLPP